MSDTLFVMTLNEIRIRNAGEDGTDDNAEWRLNVDFGVDRTSTRFRFENNSVNDREQFTGSGGLSSVNIPVREYINSNGLFVTPDFFVRASGQEIDRFLIFEFEEDLPRINAASNFAFTDLNDVSFAAGGAGAEFSYNLHFSVDLRFEELAIGGAGPNGIDRSASGGPVLLVGQQGNDTLVGSTGDDVISGGQGNDVMTGGDGNDTFLFGQESFIPGRGASVDAIIDFQDGMDVIQFDQEGINLLTFDKVIGAATQSGTSTVIDLSAAVGLGERARHFLVLSEVDKNSLGPSDFMFF